MTTFTLDIEEKQAQSPPLEAQGPGAARIPAEATSNSQPDHSEYTEERHIPASSSTTPGVAITTIIYEGYQFFKADPIPGQKATWTRVERTRMHLTQSEFYKMVQKRANKVSAAQQYLNLSPIRRVHVNQLIHERKKQDRSVEWSCVYAKEHERPSKARNANRADYETISMDIILMKRPLNTTSYPRTPMGDLVDLAHGQNDNGVQQIKFVHPRIPAAAVYNTVPATTSAQKDQDLACELGGIAQGPQPRPVSVMSPFMRLGLAQHAPVSSEQKYGLHQGQAGTDNCGDQNTIDFEGRSSVLEGNDIEDAESMIEDSSEIDDSSSPENAAAEHMEFDCKEPSHLRFTCRNRSSSPNKRDPLYHASQYRRKSRGRHFSRTDKLRYHYTDLFASKGSFHNAIPVRRARGLGGAALRASSDVKMWYPIQRIDDEELRRRLLECEARIERWERALESQSKLLQLAIQDSEQQPLEWCRLY